MRLSANFEVRLALATLFAIAMISGAVFAQGEKPSSSKDDLEPERGLMIVIFSPELESSRRSAAQGIVWDSFVARLKKKKISPLGVMNEVAIDTSSDRARAFELAGIQPDKFTMWVQFGAIAEDGDLGTKKETVPSERLVAKFIIFAPHSSEMVSQGEFEQERSFDSRYETANNQKPLRDNTGRVVNIRTDRTLPDGSSFNGPKLLDNDALMRVGERLADRAINVIRRR